MILSMAIISQLMLTLTTVLLIRTGEKVVEEIMLGTSVPLASFVIKMKLALIVSFLVKRMHLLLEFITLKEPLTMEFKSLIFDAVAVKFSLSFNDLRSVDVLEAALLVIVS